MSDKQLNINISNLNSLLKLKYGSDDSKSKENELKQHSPDLSENIVKSLEGKTTCSLDLFAAIIKDLNNK